MPRIVLVEDDPAWEAEARSAFEAGLPRDYTLDLIETEGEFIERLEQHAFERERPVLFVLDVMLPWDIPRPNMRPPPKEVAENGFYRAGVRCQKALATSSLAQIPLVFWTIVAKNDLEKEYAEWPPHALYVAKEPDLHQLVEVVRTVIRK